MYISKKFFVWNIDQKIFNEDLKQSYYYLGPDMSKYYELINWIIQSNNDEVLFIPRAMLDGSYKSV